MEAQTSRPTSSKSITDDLLLLDLNPKPQDFSYLDQDTDHLVGDHSSVQPEHTETHSSAPISSNSFVNPNPIVSSPYVERREFPTVSVQETSSLMTTTQIPTTVPVVTHEPKFENVRTPVRVNSAPVLAPPSQIVDKLPEFYMGYPKLEAPAPVERREVPLERPSYVQQHQQMQHQMHPNQMMMNPHTQMAQQMPVPTVVMPDLSQVQKTQQAISNTNALVSQQAQQTKEMMSSMDRTFDKILTFMESVDKRLSRLENQTAELQKNQQSLQQKVSTISTPQPVSPTSLPYYGSTFPTPPQSTPSTQMGGDSLPFSGGELEVAVKLQQTLDADAALAKRLQDEIETDELLTPRAVAKKVTTEECPICQKKFSSNLLTSHVNECIEKNAKPEDRNQPGFWQRLFAKKTEATPPPSTATDTSKDKEVPLAKNKPTTTTTTNPTTITPPPTFSPQMYPGLFQPQFMPMPMNPNGQTKGVPTQTPFFYPQYQPSAYQTGQPYFYVPQQYPPSFQPQPQPKK